MLLPRKPRKEPPFSVSVKIVLKHDPISASLFLSQYPAADEPCQGLILQSWMTHESRRPEFKPDLNRPMHLQFSLESVSTQYQFVLIPYLCNFSRPLMQIRPWGNNKWMTQKAGTGLSTIVLRPRISVLCLFM